MAEYQIRPVTQGDLSALGQIKSDYVRRLYRGFIPQELLKTATPEYYQHELTQWLVERNYRISVMTHAGQPTSFIVYADDPDDENCGLIYESASTVDTLVEEKHALVNHAVDLFRAEHRAAVHLWVLRDNFHVRFLIENMGFRPDGVRQQRHMINQELTITRYVRHL